jgi:hypothetical protein
MLYSGLMMIWHEISHTRDHVRDRNNHRGQILVSVAQRARGIMRLGQHVVVPTSHKGGARDHLSHLDRALIGHGWLAGRAPVLG